MDEEEDPIGTTTTTAIAPDPSFAPATTSDEAFRWTVVTVVQALTVFVVAGLAEIGGGYLVWKSIRGEFSNNDDNDNNMTTTRKRWYYAMFGSLLLVLYGFIPTLQPTDSFGRIYAVYGGFFIVLSFLAGWYLDNDRPDLGDIIGGSVALVGVLVVLFWPR